MKFRSKAARLDRLIDEPIVDCYNESEEITKVSRRDRGVRREEIKTYVGRGVTH